MNHVCILNTLQSLSSNESYKQLEGANHSTFILLTGVTVYGSCLSCSSKRNNLSSEPEPGTGTKKHQCSPGSLSITAAEWSSNSISCASGTRNKAVATRFCLISYSFQKCTNSVQAYALACDLSKANAPHQLAEQISELGLDNLQRKNTLRSKLVATSGLITWRRQTTSAVRNRTNEFTLNAWHEPQKVSHLALEVRWPRLAVQWIFPFHTLDFL